MLLALRQLEQFEAIALLLFLLDNLGINLICLIKHKNLMGYILVRTIHLTQ